MSILRHFTLLSCDEIDSLVGNLSDDSWLGEIDLTLLEKAFPRRNDRLGRPPHNREAMFTSLLLMRREQIPTIVALIRRLKESSRYRERCGFGQNERIPGSDDYSRFIKRLAETQITDDIYLDQRQCALDEGLASGESAALDVTHILAREKRPAKKTVAPPEEAPASEPEPDEPKKRTRRTRAQIEADYATKLASHFGKSSSEWLAEIGTQADYNKKHDANGQMVHWFGYKLGAVVDHPTGFILDWEVGSASPHDSRYGYLLFAKMREHGLRPNYLIADSAFDDMIFYEALHMWGTQGIIPLNARSAKQKAKGYDDKIRPKAACGALYVYDSYDGPKETLKFTRPKECKPEGCPFADECPKARKLRITENLRLLCGPCRGSRRWEKLYDERTVSERSFSFLKENLQAETPRYAGIAKVRVHLALSIIVSNAIRMHAQRQRLAKAA
jgi:transposase